MLGYIAWEERRGKEERRGEERRRRERDIIQYSNVQYNHGDSNNLEKQSCRTVLYNVIHYDRKSKRTILNFKWLHAPYDFSCMITCSRNIIISMKSMTYWILLCIELNCLQGRVSSALKDIPVFGVLVDDLGERGAHYIAARELMRK